jgi:hypothetical protein
MEKNPNPNRQQRRLAERELRRQKGPQHGLAKNLAAQGAIGDLIKMQVEAVREHGMPPNTRRVAAIHEAGHCTVALAMGGIFKEAYIKKAAAGWEGFTSIRVPGVHGSDLTVQSDPARAWLLGLNMLAGIAAEIEAGVYHPAANIEESFSAAQIAGQAAMLKGSDPRAAISELMLHCAAIIQANNAPFKAIAEAFEQRGHITAAEVAQQRIVQFGHDTLVPGWLKGGAA